MSMARSGWGAPVGECGRGREGCGADEGGAGQAAEGSEGHLAGLLTVGGIVRMDATMPLNALLRQACSASARTQRLGGPRLAC